MSANVFSGDFQDREIGAPYRGYPYVRSPDEPREMVGDPGIEPGMGFPGGVTVRCRTLQHVAQ